MKDCMIDIETLGQSPRAVVLSIGAVFFDTASGVIGEKAKWTLNLPEQIATLQREINADTLLWWQEQSPEARIALKQSSMCRIESAQTMSSFAEWLKRHAPGGTYVWGNGATFDITILETLFEEVKVACPWSFRSVMDLRTFKRFVADGAKIEKLGVAHDALDDAISQAHFVMSHQKTHLNKTMRPAPLAASSNGRPVLTNGL